MAAFYTSAFGWQTELLGPEMGSHTVVTTTETEAGRPTTPGAINGGFFLRTSDARVTDAIGRDRRSGHRRVAARQSSRRAGRLRVRTQGSRASAPMPGFHDTEGNRVGLLQPLPRG